jgi:hypothetical protein
MGRQCPHGIFFRERTAANQRFHDRTRMGFGTRSLDLGFGRQTAFLQDLENKLLIGTHLAVLGG